MGIFRCTPLRAQSAQAAHHRMKLFNRNYTASFTPRLRVAGVNGLADFNNCSILIDSSLTDEQAESTVLHEIIELINEALELRLPHRTITCLETALYDALTSNNVSLSALLPMRDSH